MSSSIYLKGHLYGNSRTKDLWAGISEASGLDVAKIMANWTLKVRSRLQLSCQAHVDLCTGRLPRRHRRRDRRRPSSQAEPLLECVPPVALNVRVLIHLS
jgi:hypothetical protein